MGTLRSRSADPLGDDLLSCRAWVVVSDPFLEGSKVGGEPAGGGAGVLAKCSRVRKAAGLGRKLPVKVPVPRWERRASRMHLHANDQQSAPSPACAPRLHGAGAGRRRLRR